MSQEHTETNTFSGVGSYFCNDISTLCMPQHLVTLCIILPNSERIQHKFNYERDQIKTVINVAHSFLHEDKVHNFDIDDACLSDNSVPVKVYSDHFLTLSQAGLIHNTVLHFSYKY